MTKAVKETRHLYHTWMPGEGLLKCFSLTEDCWSFWLVLASSPFPQRTGLQGHLFPCSSAESTPLVSVLKASSGRAAYTFPWELIPVLCYCNSGSLCFWLCWFLHATVWAYWFLSWTLSVNLRIHHKRLQFFSVFAWLFFPFVFLLRKWHEYCGPASPLHIGTWQDVAVLRCEEAPLDWVDGIQICFAASLKREEDSHGKLPADDCLPDIQ